MDKAKNLRLSRIFMLFSGSLKWGLAERKTEQCGSGKSVKGKDVIRKTQCEAEVVASLITHHSLLITHKP